MATLKKKMEERQLKAVRLVTQAKIDAEQEARRIEDLERRQRSFIGLKAMQKPTELSSSMFLVTGLPVSNIMPSPIANLGF